MSKIFVKNESFANSKTRIRKNGLKDENGNVYVIYPVRALAKYIWVKRNKCQGKG